ncbi:MAG: FTR1 family iron permease [Oscillospiraceae bacterium]|nr:FTR1 family iron permease [Oscillospiraceae bacterium]
MFAIASAALLVIAFTATAALAAEYATWRDIADEMGEVLSGAYELYASGDPDAAKDEINVAYYQYYEKLGFEKQVNSLISGNRAATVELQFSFAKSAINSGASQGEVKAMLDELAQFLREDADALDGKGGGGEDSGATANEGGAVVFVESLLIITREGFEAILIVGAIIAYLVKSGNGDKVGAVYRGSIIALAASVAMAFILNAVTSASGGKNQEIIEGVTMLIAVVVLFYVSNWMVSKAESAAWTSYIEGKVQSSITAGSVFSLAFAAFLAVFREGAETILFYQALLADTNAHINMVWLGLGVGAVGLVVIYLIIRFMSVKLPLKPFFIGTSILMFLMSVTFIGSGIKELSEGDLFYLTPVQGVATIDILGIYPALETLIPQAVLLAAAVVTFVIQTGKWRKAREARDPQGE